MFFEDLFFFTGKLYTDHLKICIQNIKSGLLYDPVQEINMGSYIKNSNFFILYFSIQYGYQNIGLFEFIRYNRKNKQNFIKNVYIFNNKFKPKLKNKNQIPMNKLLLDEIYFFFWGG